MEKFDIFHRLFDKLQIDANNIGLASTRNVNWPTSDSKSLLFTTHDK